ncbi:MAG: DUF3052 domain-containing protein [Alphaproteobacteria bacterium]|nr:DUF3052 domain-containing protein [Alphaproteobacteria bacterium]
MAGYSKTPLFKKLGLKHDMKAVCLNAPENYLALLGRDAPEQDWLDGLGTACDFVHLFTKSKAELEARLPACQDAIKATGMIWVSWPKKASKVPTDITEDTIRSICLPSGLVDVKVCAVDDIWSGLKLVIRKELR